MTESSRDGKTDKDDAVVMVCRRMFGEDWLDALTTADKALLHKYGLIKARDGRHRITPCPATKRAALDRALGRTLRMEAQRNTALHWIENSGRVRTVHGYIDTSALLRAMEFIAPSDKSISERTAGRKPHKSNKAMLAMLADLRSGAELPDVMLALSHKILTVKYGVSPNTAASCRTTALATFAAERKLKRS